jgi:hypothetical protein
MSRSRKKIPIRWFKGRSAKQDKCMRNRIVRRISKQRIEKPVVSIREATKKMGGFKVVGKTIFWGCKKWIRKKDYRK